MRCLDQFEYNVSRLLIGDLVCFTCQNDLIALTAAGRDVEFEDLALGDCADAFALFALLVVGEVGAAA